ncbi:hypothetical protein [Nocardia donostiensis]|uniref:Uncharacterized protein n=1 Tax=Nocardia donostiensis TaxID=1538463 RepID=A0A1V2TCY3_9NOCA|nr:hypothetical protein [Nocardia donostiensis]ONM47318.1 hypothetical protein B0T46_18820 [Nocardia donostiensis]OQS16620.1 hypothetical protein B0T36_02770 [Nocardia donostiensis]OQS21097.1 hypothetical protein B0T44_08750 [Nocardia donostiensis]
MARSDRSGCQIEAYARVLHVGGPDTITLAGFARTAIALAGSGWLETGPAGITTPVPHHRDLPTE